MKTFSISTISILKHWHRKPLQLFFALIGLSLATALWSSIQLLNSQAKNSYETAVDFLTASETEIILPLRSTSISIEVFGELRRAGWPVTPILEGKIPGQRPVTIIGIDPFTMSESRGLINKLSDEENPFQEFVLNNNFGFASEETKAYLETLSLELDISVSAQLSANIVITDISLAEKILGEQGKISRFELTAPPLKNWDFLEELDLRLVESNSLGDLEQLTKSFHLNLSAFGLLGFVVGLFIVHSTLSLAFEQRKATYMTFRSIGVPIWTVYTSALSEIVVLALMGGIIGVFLGHWLAFILFPNVASTFNNIYGINLGDQLVLSVTEVFLALLMPLLGTLLISMNFLLKLYRIAPHKLGSVVFLSKIYNNKNKIKLGSSIILISLIIILANSPLGLIKSFFIIGMTILTASILLPLVLSKILSLLASSVTIRMPLSHWFVADSAHQVNRIALSLNALMLAVAVTIGVDNMVKSFKDTFDVWLEKRLITDIYVRALDQNVAAQLIKNLRNEPMVKNIYPIVSSKSRFQNQPIDIVGFLPAEIYSKNWPLVESSEVTWERVRSGEGVLANEQFCYRHNLNVGDLIKLDSGLNSNLKIPFRIAGVYADYGNSLGQIMVKIDSYHHHFSRIPPTNFALEVPSNSFAKISDILTRNYGLVQSEIIDQSTIKELSTKIFDRTFAITSSLSDAMIIIATLTILISLITLSEIRVTNLAPLWVLGITRLTLLKLELSQFILMILFTLLFAIPTGLLICHFLTSYLNIAAFGWKLPVQYYPEIWIKTLIIASTTSILAIIFPTVLLFKNSASLMIRRYKNDA